MSDFHSDCFIEIAFALSAVLIVFLIFSSLTCENGHHDGVPFCKDCGIQTAEICECGNAITSDFCDICGQPKSAVSNDDR